MKRKVYASRRERMIDQIMGFVAFPLVNIPLGTILWRISSMDILSRTNDASLLLVLVSALPWIVNGIILVLAFLLRPEFAVGYISFIGAAVAVVIALSTVVVAACFVIIPLAPVIGDLVNWVFIFLIAVGLLVLVSFAIELFRGWWSPHDDNSH